MLEEVQVPVALGEGVVDRMLPLCPGELESAASREIDTDRERLRASIDFCVRYIPRARHAQRGLKQLLAHVQPRLKEPSLPTQI